MSTITYVPFISYLRIAADAHTKMVEYINDGEAEDAAFQHTAQGEATIAVVFATIALESFIHNYAARKLGEGYTKTHIDKMGLHTKWIVIPRLATGRAITSDHRGIELLQKLIKARNLIVHLKGANIQVPLYDQAVANIKKDNRLILESATTCFECIGELGRAIAETDPDDELVKVLAGFSDTPKYRLMTHGSKNP